MEHEHKEKTCNCEGKCCCSSIDKLPSRLAFWAGVLLTAGTLFAVGFIVLLVLMFKGVELSSAVADKDTTITDTAQADTTVTAQANQPTASGKVDPSSLRNTRGTGDYTVVEYSDTECPFCKRFHGTLQQMLTEYDGKVRWSYKHLPLKSLHQKANREANATECAAEQGKFWEYVDLLYETTTSNDGLADEELYTMADNVGLDRTKFDSCLEDTKYQDTIDADSAEAQKLGGQGTPFSVLIDGDGNVVDVISGALPFDSVAATLDQYVK